MVRQQKSSRGSWTSERYPPTGENLRSEHVVTGRKANLLFHKEGLHLHPFSALLLSYHSFCSGDDFCDPKPSLNSNCEQTGKDWKSNTGVMGMLLTTSDLCFAFLPEDTWRYQVKNTSVKQDWCNWSTLNWETKSDAPGQNNGKILEKICSTKKVKSNLNIIKTNEKERGRNSYFFFLVARESLPANLRQTSKSEFISMPQPLSDSEQNLTDQTDTQIRVIQLDITWKRKVISNSGCDQLCHWRACFFSTK